MFFTIEGAPFGKQRPRHNRRSGVTYTPRETRDRERHIVAEYRRQCGGEQIEADKYVVLHVDAYYPIPTSATKKRREQIAAGGVYPTVKPDIDNVLKLVEDALNGVAYADDKQIVSVAARKWYSSHPRIEVWVAEMPKTEEKNGGQVLDHR